MPLRHFPPDLLKEARMLWELQGMVVGAGQTAFGAMPLTRLDGGGLWKANLSQIKIWTADQRRTWRALSAICDGGAQAIVVPVRETFDQPWPTINGVVVTGFDQTPHDDLSTFGDGSAYDSGVIGAVSIGAVALRATRMIIRVNAGAAIRGGEYFSIDHQTWRHRLYRIATADPSTSTPSPDLSNYWDVTFRPPLRAAIADLAELNFNNPKCVMRLAMPDSMDLTLEPPFIADAKIELIEAFPPFPE